ncbi:TniQ family protein [Luteibacter sp. 3190]|uniref:TniQ family protein n=1 Tax=Luteibacter sp. 3190 TaxID=2817736 RepID=UPI002858585D|nr:TniQ family protein [Luteibacter sp. 3190]MDR6935720.1 hypothetical protein [Luteibacter sp. 3190]
MTAWQEYRYGGPRERWWIKAPMRDETIDSVIERASHVYGGIVLRRGGWFTDVLGAKGTDGIPWESRDIARLSRLLQVPVARMQRARVDDAPDTLVPGQRRAFCPACWLEDDAAGRPRYFRKAWARVLYLSCATHNDPLEWAATPLFPMHRMHILRRHLSATDDARWLMDVLDQFAQTLEWHMFGGLSWPGHWRMSGYQARALLCHCLSHLESEEGRSVGQFLWPGPGDPTLYQPRREDVPPWRGCPWEAVRRAGRPSWRRGALWITASMTLPDFPVNCCRTATHGR